MPCLPQTILNSWTLQYLHATAVSPWTAFPTLFRILLNVHLLHALQLDCYCDTDTYNTWLLIKLTPKGVVFSFSFSFFFSDTDTAPANNTRSAAITALAALPASVVVTTIAVAADCQKGGLQQDAWATKLPCSSLSSI
jgi:hypothetical protein